MNSESRIINRLPTPKEFIAILNERDETTDLSEDNAILALKNSLYGVVALCNGKTVGMGRIVSDNATIFVIHDVFVTASNQSAETEVAILDALLMYVESTAPSGAVIIAFSSPNQVATFKQLGLRSTAPEVFGMFRIIDRTDPDRQLLRWA